MAKAAAKQQQQQQQQQQQPKRALFRAYVAAQSVVPIAVLVAYVGLGRLSASSCGGAGAALSCPGALQTALRNWRAPGHRSALAALLAVLAWCAFSLWHLLLSSSSSSSSKKAQQQQQQSTAMRTYLNVETVRLELFVPLCVFLLSVVARGQALQQQQTDEYAAALSSCIGVISYSPLFAAALGTALLWTLGSLFVVWTALCNAAACAPTATTSAKSGRKSSSSTAAADFDAQVFSGDVQQGLLPPMHGMAAFEKFEWCDSDSGDDDEDWSGSADDDDDSDSE
jgi:hypothetical protein